MNSKVIVALLAAGLTVPMFAQKPVQAATTSFDASQFTGSAAKVNVTLDDNNGSGQITVTVRVVTDAQNPNTADIRGFFFNVADSGILSGLSASGTHVNATSFTGNVSSVGNANLNGDGGQASFGGGVEIGENGLRGGRDDIRSTTFTLSHANMPLTLGMFSAQDFGVRLTSVGLPNGSREGSSKLEGSSAALEAPGGGESSGGGSVEEDETVTETPVEENVGGGTPADGGEVVNEPVNEEQPTEVADGSGGGNVPEGGMGGGDVEEVPEPMTIAGSALGLAGLMKLRRRRANKAN
jgi:hypothetical protein